MDYLETTYRAVQLLVPLNYDGLPDPSQREAILKETSMEISPQISSHLLMLF